MRTTLDAVAANEVGAASSRTRVVLVASSLVLLAVILAGEFSAWQASIDAVRALATGHPELPGTPDSAIQREIGYSGDPRTVVVVSGWPIPVIHNETLAVRVNHSMEDRTHSMPAPIRLTTHAVFTGTGWLVNEIDANRSN